MRIYNQENYDHFLKQLYIFFSKFIKKGLENFEEGVQFISFFIDQPKSLKGTIGVIRVVKRNGMYCM